MGRITIVQAADPYMEKEAACTKRRAEDMGYDYLFYPLSPSTDTERNSSKFIPCKFKPGIILDALDRIPGGILVYLDADVALVKPLEIGPFDLAYCLRPEDEIDQNRGQPDVGTVNTGILFFSKNAIPFVEKWLSDCTTETTEQRSFNRLIGGPLPPAIDVQILPRKYYHAYIPTSEAHLVHYKGGNAHQIHQFCEDCDA